jgi:glycosyltransferase involved in cell wall biosynthesis
MSAGLPVIASDYPRWREIVDDAGCGLLVDPTDPAAIAAAMQWILDHPEEAEAMGERGRRAILDRYSWDREADKLIELYATLIPFARQEV